jgi:hypothetical protein
MNCVQILEDVDGRRKEEEEEEEEEEGRGNKWDRWTDGWDETDEGRINLYYYHSFFFTHQALRVCVCACGPL